MPSWRPLQTLAIIATLSLAPVAHVAAQPSSDHAAHADGSAATGSSVAGTPTPDAGSGSATLSPPPTTDGSGVAQPASSTPSSVKADDPESVAKAAYKAITTKNWFLLAGCALAALSFLIQIPLKKKLSVFGGKHADKVAWATTGILAGIGALANAWIADVPVLTSQTAYGALKVFAAAVFAYVSSKKLFGNNNASDDSASPA